MNLANSNLPQCLLSLNVSKFLHTNEDKEKEICQIQCFCLLFFVCLRQGLAGSSPGRLTLNFRGSSVSAWTTDWSHRPWLGFAQCCWVKRSSLAEEKQKKTEHRQGWGKSSLCWRVWGRGGVQTGPRGRQDSEGTVSKRGLWSSKWPSQQAGNESVSLFSIQLGNTRNR